MTIYRDRAKAECGTCGGPITYYARPAADTAPRTTSIDDQQRWAHDQLADALRAPHRAHPKVAA